ncbi:MAG: CoA pyrophosphatase [Candidatus Heimdallarchaeaceae archaeon]
MIAYKKLNEQLIDLDAPIKEAEDFRLAAVLVPIFIKKDALLLTKRTETLRQHKGEIAFPGGKYDKKDIQLINTCLRETNEEVGIKAEDINLIGRLNPVYATSGNLVYPFVGIINADVTIAPNPEEVAEVFFAPISKLLDPNRYKKGIIHSEIHNYYLINGFKIWGVTERIVSDLIERIRKIA